MSDEQSQSVEQRVVSTLYVTIAIILIILTGSIIGGVAMYGTVMAEESALGVQIGNVPVGGMSEEELTIFLTDMTEKLLDESMVFTIETASGTEQLRLEPLVIVSGDGTVRELVRFDVATAVSYIMQYGKKSNRFTQGLSLLKIRFENPVLALPGVSVDRLALISELTERTVQHTTAPITASIDIASTDPIRFSITASEPGAGYEFKTIDEAVRGAYEELRVPDVAVPRVVIAPDILESDLLALESQIETVLAQFPVQIIYTASSTNDTAVWTLYRERAATLLKPKRDGSIYLGVHEEKFLAYLEDIIAPEVEVAPQDARFIMKDGKVSEFQVAKNGIGIATTTMVDRIDTAIKVRNNTDGASTNTVKLAVQVVEPAVSTDDVNDLGITELLGVGISNFSGSPTNRIGNIRNAVNKLNGIIVAPGEEFSTIEHTKPYTIAGGYLPEKVIKGDSITPEIGGGLCQIGTTLFRMAMNSGLEITERRNHSLVVGYYNDLENGLPGTDATLYDPAPDFKFRNDTEHYILIETTMDVSTGFLKFYLWGTSDGRTASYTSPTVLEWYNPGEARYIESKDLAPGETQCQSAFRGAYASFTYTRQLPGQEEPEETEFTSRYRALPKICLIGVEESKECQELPDGSTSCNPDEAPTDEPSPDTTPTAVTPTFEPVASST